MQTLQALRSVLLNICHEEKSWDSLENVRSLIFDKVARQTLRTLLEQDSITGVFFETSQFFQSSYWTANIQLNTGELNTDEHQLVIIECLG